MRKRPELYKISLALFSAMALFAFGCGREAEEPEVASQPTEEARPAAPYTVEEEPEREVAGEETTGEEDVPSVEGTLPKNPELQEPRPPVVVEPETRSPDRDPELEERERQLEQRQAELEARERRIREQERRQRETRETRAREAQRPAEREEPRRETAREPQQTRPAETETEEVEARPEAEPEREPRESRESETPEVEAEPEPEHRTEPRATTATVAAGTVFAAELQETLSSDSSRVGETFRARIVDDVVEDGEVVIPAGSDVVGEVTEAVPLRKVGGRARLAIRFTDLVLPSGNTVPIQATMTEQGRNETGRDAATIGGGAAGGAVLGRILNRKDRSKGALIGAIIGAAAGAVIASRTPGEEAMIPEGTVVNIELKDSVEVRLRR